MFTCACGCLQKRLGLGMCELTTLFLVGVYELEQLTPGWSSSVWIFLVLQVSLGEMAVNYSALVLEQRISLRNIPSGVCSITLSADDLGNFVVHELLKEAVSTVSMWRHQGW